VEVLSQERVGGGEGFLFIVGKVAVIGGARPESVRAQPQRVHQRGLALAGFSERPACALNAVVIVPRLFAGGAGRVVVHARSKAREIPLVKRN